MQKARQKSAATRLRRTFFPEMDGWMGARRFGVPHTLAQHYRLFRPKKAPVCDLAREM
jgi:hypothetical protein